MNVDEYSDSELDEDYDKSGPATFHFSDSTLDQEGVICDDSTCVMYYQAQTGAPCLSFDTLQDNLGDGREQFPLTCYVVAGTQAERGKTNHVIVMKLSNLRRTSRVMSHSDYNSSDEDDDEISDSGDEVDTAELKKAVMVHPLGSVNRIRSIRHSNKTLAASWSNKGKVSIWDLSRPLLALDDPTVMRYYTRNEESPSPIFVFSGHQDEGYALDWSQVTPGQLLSGDCSKNIYLWTPTDGSWQIDKRPFCAHKSSVEDIQWSPNEASVFASCSIDKSIRIWDIRISPRRACMLQVEDAHNGDVNVISWNRNKPFMVSGGDDGVLKVWDLRKFQHGKAASVFEHHAAPIASVEWNPTDSSVFAAAGLDDQITIWDMSAEGSEGEFRSESGVPDELLFIHQGQADIKEIHWHEQLPGVIFSTARSGFNVFRTISV